MRKSSFTHTFWAKPSTRFFFPTPGLRTRAADCFVHWTVVKHIQLLNSTNFRAFNAITFSTASKKDRHELFKLSRTFFSLPLTFLPQKRSQVLAAFGVWDGTHAFLPSCFATITLKHFEFPRYPHRTSHSHFYLWRL